MEAAKTLLHSLTYLELKEHYLRKLKENGIRNMMCVLKLLQCLRFNGEWIVRICTIDQLNYMLTVVSVMALHQKCELRRYPHTLEIVPIGKQEKNITVDFYGIFLCDIENAYNHKCEPNVIDVKIRLPNVTSTEDDTPGRRIVKRKTKNTSFLSENTSFLPENDVMFKYEEIDVVELGNAVEDVHLQDDAPSDELYNDQ